MNIVTLLGSPRSAGNSATIARRIAATADELDADIRLVRACGIGPGTVDAVPPGALQQAEETVRQLLS